MIPNERLDELAKLEAAATPGPWRLVEPPDWAEPIAEQDRRDDAFRVASRNEFRAMIEQCREANRLREERTHWQRAAHLLAARLSTYSGNTVLDELCEIERRMKGPTP